jgi:hypothetical protein
MTKATQASQGALISCIGVSDSTSANKIMESIGDTQSTLLFNKSSHFGALAGQPRGLKSLLNFPQRFLLALGLLFAAFLRPGFVHAQNSVTGALTGVVEDSTGAIVPGANVKIVDTATNATINVKANEAGRYNAPLLKPSKYEVTATASGLSAAPTIVTVLVGQVPNLDLTVNPAGTTTVNVSSQAVQLTDTQSPASITTLT